MNDFQLDKDVRIGETIHMIGIGGISMSGLAEALLFKGYKVSGSDINTSPLIEALQSKGADIKIGHAASNVGDCSLVVYTAAVKKENPEMIEAFRRGIPTIERSVLLGAIMRDYKNAVAVAGTHGKTTTTGMLASVFMHAKKDPTVSIGGELADIRNFKLGQSDIFVTEACEYHRSFLEFFPKIAIILNVEEDHLDYYRDLSDIKSAFRDFASLVPEDGAAVVCADCENAIDAVSESSRKVITYSTTKKADFMAVNLKENVFCRYSFDVMHHGKMLTTVHLSVPGRLMVDNALAAFATASLLGVDIQMIADGLASFQGVKRRMETVGFMQDVLILDDYAHHPTEIASTIKTLKSIAKENIHLLFQPHTYTRTATLFDSFVKVFSDPDLCVYFLDIYAAREKDTGYISSRDLRDKIPGSIYFPSFAEAESYLISHAKPNDIIVTVGAGDVWKIGRNLVDKNNI